MPRNLKSKRPARKVWKSRPRSRRLQPAREMASCKETHFFAQLTSGTAYYDYAVSLARFARASGIAKGYREFRITKVEYIFKPLADTFAPVGPSAASIPTLLKMIDKTGSMRDFNTAEELRRAGARPVRFDDKNIVVSYKPCVLSFVRDEANSSNQFSKPVVSPWLSCDKFNDDPAPQAWQANSIDHLGIAWLVEQSVGAPLGYQVEMVAHFQFRKPSYLRTIVEGQTGAIQAPSVNEIQPEEELSG